MTAEDASSLIDWNSPIEEFNCQPLIPLPKFDGQPRIDGDNPFDDLEMKINQNEPFDLMLNQSLNSTSERNDLIKVTSKYNHKEKTTSDLSKPNDAKNLTNHLVEIPDQLNMKTNLSHNKTSSESDSCSSPNISNIDLSIIEDDSSEVKMIRKRLSIILDQFSKPSDQNNDNVANGLLVSSPPNFLSTGFSVKSESKGSEILNSPGKIDKAFIGDESLNITFDSLAFGDNNLNEDLISIKPVWDELEMTSSSDEEVETRLTKYKTVQNSSNKKKTFNEKTIKKSCPRLPLGSKDPNIRSKKTKVVREEGPLRAVIPIENMTKMKNLKLEGIPQKQNRYSQRLKADSTSLKYKRRSAPIATSTPVISPNLHNKSNLMRSKLSTSSVSSLSCPPSPDSTSTQFRSKSFSKLSDSAKKGCTRKLALNVVSSSTSVTYLPGIRKSYKDAKSVSMNSTTKSTATGVKSCVRNKENIIPFRC